MLPVSAPDSATGHGRRTPELMAFGLRHRSSDGASVISALVLQHPCAKISQLFNAKSVDMVGF